MLQTAVKIAAGLSLCFLPVLAGLYGLILSRLFNWSEQRIGPWLLRAGFAALAAPSLAFDANGVRPVPALYPLLQGEWLEASGGLAVVSMGLIGTGVLGYYGWFYRRNMLAR